MKLKSLLIIIGCLSVIHLRAQDVVELTFYDSFNGSGSQCYNMPSLAKAQRTNSKASSIIVNENKEIQDEALQKVVDYVTSVWKSAILNAPDIKIQIEMADIESDIETVVGYTNTNNIAYPTSLYNYMNQANQIISTKPDGIIKINKNTSWDYSLGDNIQPNTKNLAFGLMRAYARIMGFGSDVSTDGNGNYSFLEKRSHTIFNTLISNSTNAKLTAIGKNGGRPSSELKRYIEEQGQTFWVNTNDSKYKLSSPPYSKSNPPFVFMDNSSSLMGAKPSIGSYILQVDKCTDDILHAIGWNLAHKSEIAIISDDIPNTGLASAYESHEFKIKDNDIAITPVSWALKMPLASGGHESKIIKDKGNSCTINPLSDISKYKINSDGDIEAALEFTYLKDNNEITTNPFHIYFELKPSIEYAVIESIVDESPKPSYSAYYKVKYKGADKIKVLVEEEYCTDIRLSYINEPNIANGCAEHIKAPYYAWIDFVAENKYGKDIYTIELGPYGKVAKQSVNVSDTFSTEDTNQIRNMQGYESFNIYDESGLCITTIDNLSDLDQIQKNGIFIIRGKKQNGEIRTIKIFNK